MTFCAKRQLKYLFFAVRPTQWVKNFIIFLPVIFGRQLFNLSVLFRASLFFIVFCVASSAIYLINDIVDLKKDKTHPLKRLRPLASGKITVLEAYIVALFLAGVAIASSLAITLPFAVLIIIYLLFNLFYSTILKNVVIIDVLCIGFFFLLRIVAGSLAARVMVSHWIIFCTVFLALFIGFNKRRCELKLLKSRATDHRLVLANYDPYFIDQMISVITASMVITYTLYTVDATTVRNLGSDHLMYSIPFVYYGVFRYIYLVQKRGRGGDPIQVLLSDDKMQLNLILWVVVCIAVIYFKI